MPGIIITPGSFNPPATPVQSMGVLTFPKTPVATVRRHPQYSTRWADAPVVAGSPVDDVLYNPDFIYAVGPVGSGVASAMTIAGCRYIPNGTYPVTDVGSGLYQYQFPPVGAGSYIFAGAISGFFHDPEGGSSSATTAVSYDFALSVVLEGCDDGAVYEVYGIYPGSPGSGPALLTNAGGGVWTATGSDETILSPTISGGAVEPETVELLQTAEIELWRDGVLFETHYVDAGSIVTVNYVEVGSPVVDTTVPAPDLQAVPLVMYGPGVTFPPVTPPACAQVQWSRRCFATQGTVTIS